MEKKGEEAFLPLLGTDIKCYNAFHIYFILFSWTLITVHSVTG